MEKVWCYRDDCLHYNPGGGVAQDGKFGCCTQTELVISRNTMCTKYEDIRDVVIDDPNDVDDEDYEPVEKIADKCINDCGKIAKTVYDIYSLLKQAADTRPGINNLPDDDYDYMLASHEAREKDCGAR